MMGNRLEVIGVGTVNLPTKISPTANGPDSHGVLPLNNVLHAPSALCNILGAPLMDDHDVSLRPDSASRGSIVNSTDRRPVAYFKPRDESVLFEVRLSDPPVGPRVGPSPFEPDVAYMIHALWPSSEWQRFEALQASRQAQATASEALTPAEKQWLKKHYGNEFKFLRSHGLSIYKDEDREEGRSILRAFMSDDGDEAMTRSQKGCPERQNESGRNRG
ncbi:hypothetical protein N7461_004906 [Penicillium sp. DV-2018c]|nr:hypothetical protein N7461_004906 [Penicillium sp. DV-2018c]